jgi:hypothetical protein
MFVIWRRIFYEFASLRYKETSILQHFVTTEFGTVMLC